ncbi:MAG: type IV pilin protein [Steroidobacteraceae bacterium]
MRKRQRGVTLIELLTVMVVIAIIASIAIPSYRRYILRAQRTDAKTALLQAQTAEEKFVLQNNFYSTSMAGGPGVGLGLTGASEKGLYNIDVLPALTNQDGTAGYTVRAQPAAVAGGQADDTDCVVFLIDGAGVRTATNSGGADNSAACWR